MRVFPNHKLNLVESLFSSRLNSTPYTHLDMLLKKSTMANPVRTVRAFVDGTRSLFVQTPVLVQILWFAAIWAVRALSQATGHGISFSCFLLGRQTTVTLQSDTVKPWRDKRQWRFSYRPVSILC